MKTVRRAPHANASVLAGAALLGAMSCWSGPASADHADQSAPLNVAGLADACTSCHGIDGHSASRIPSIGGLDRARLAGEFRAFRAGKLDATIMNRIARGYSDAEIEALAGYFSSVRAP